MISRSLWLYAMFIPERIMYELPDVLCDIIRQYLIPKTSPLWRSGSPCGNAMRKAPELLLNSRVGHVTLIGKYEYVYMFSPLIELHSDPYNIQNKSILQFPIPEFYKYLVQGRKHVLLEIPEEELKYYDIAQWSDDVIQYHTPHFAMKKLLPTVDYIIPRKLIDDTLAKTATDI